MTRRRAFHASILARATGRGQGVRRIDHCPGRHKDFGRDTLTSLPHSDIIFILWLPTSILTRTLPSSSWCAKSTTRACKWCWPPRAEEAACAALLEVPGASRSVIEATVPYAPEALAAWLGAAPEHFCTERTARAMAMAGYQRALRLTSSRQPIPRLFAVACTASLATDRAKRGSHRIHLAVQTGSETWARSLLLAKGERTRDEEEHVAMSLVLNMIAEQCNIPARLPVPLLPTETIEHVEATASPEWQGAVGRTIAGRVAGIRLRTTAMRDPGDLSRGFQSAARRTSSHGRSRPSQAGYRGRVRNLHGQRRQAAVGLH